MNMNDWIALLGRSTADAAVKAALTAAGVDDAKLKSDELTTAKNVAAGLSVTFTDETVFRPDDPTTTLDLPVLTAVVALIQNKRKPEHVYAGELAYGVGASDGQKATRKRLGKPISSDKEFRTDTFAVGGLEVRVQYTDDLNALKRFGVSLPDPD